MFVIKPAISQKNVLGWIKKYSPAPCGWKSASET